MIQATELINYSAHTVAFTGSGISVESGIPPFRGENGLWTKYDPGFLDIGTSGEVMPSSLIPIEAKKNKSKIIEINIARSSFTTTITDIFIQGKATETMEELLFILTGIVL
jgi:NAD-dependent SIR2 family protein deacetylase